MLNCNAGNVCIVVLYLTSLSLCFSLILFLSGGLFYRDAQYLHWIDGSDWPGRFDRWTEEAGERGQTEWVARAVHRGRRLRQKTPIDTPQRCFNEVTSTVIYFFFCLLIFIDNVEVLFWMSCWQMKPSENACETFEQECVQILILAWRLDS